jgi:hypothetical protein
MKILQSHVVVSESIKITLTKAAYFSNICYQTSLHSPILSGIHVAPIKKPL